MPKLRSILGFRPTAEEFAAIEVAEKWTGKKRSDILRACFKVSLSSVVNAMVAERQAHGETFREIAKQVEAQTMDPTQPAPILPIPPDKPVTYRRNKPKK